MPGDSPFKPEGGICVVTITIAFTDVDRIIGSVNYDYLGYNKALHCFFCLLVPNLQCPTIIEI